MTRKDYIKIASIIKDNTSSNDNKRFASSRLYKYSLIDDLCIMFKQDNSLFNKAKFVDACEYEED